MSYPISDGRQLDRCDICSRKMPRRYLVRTQVEFLRHPANNYIIQSSYDNSHWTTDDTADLGAISIGPYADRQRLNLANDNTVTEFMGAETFSTAKMVYSTVATDDVTSWSSLCFSAEIGPYHRSTTPGMSVVLGVYNIGDTANLYPVRTWTIRNQQRCWWTATPAEVSTLGVTLSTLGFYILATGSSWWIDLMQLEMDAVVPGKFIATSGSSETSTHGPNMTMRKVCPSCFEPILSKSNQYGRSTEIPTDGPVTPLIQEI